ncbi:neuroligin 4-like [Drosophila madeirensis]|uniref:Neuroligin 4-like n=1 Tax=Drosophila madeirensis TaxID=30013 RepID=A0AAU9F627_DROMD
MFPLLFVLFGSSIETLRAETPEEFYEPKQVAPQQQQQQQLQLQALAPDDSQLNGIPALLIPSTAASTDHKQRQQQQQQHQQQLKKMRFKREMHALALEGGDVARGYCSCDEQWTNSSSPTSTTTSATMSPTLPTGNATSSGRGNGTANGSGIVKPHGGGGGGVGGRGTRLKQQHHVRFSDEKNFSD